ncbi:MAG: endonuclease III [Bacteroidales bacterium]|nr:endonuclease III [Bacteroidales bacterium]
MNKKERYRYIIDYFRKEMPEAHSELEFNNPFQLLVAVILSAQCTDKRVNMVTPGLFAAFPDAEKMAQADIPEIYERIKSVSYPNNKARHLKGMAQMLTEKFKGVVPDKIEALQKLPGVGRKTANVMLAVAFDRPAMAVDTHVFRVAARIGLSENAKTPLETEKQLVAHIPKKEIARAHHWLILHGRYTCTARKPQCDRCGIRQACLFHEKNES